MQQQWGFALVTGASSGIGEAFARLLAARGTNLVLVARREARLKALAAELESRHGVRAVVEALDLSDPQAPERLFRRTEEAGLVVDLLVNNAGFGAYGPYAELPWSREQQMLQVDVMALSHLTKLYLPGMLARDHGGILLVASVGAYQASPSYAAYSAAKAYVLSLGEALSYELRHTGVHVTVLSPGVTESEFLEVSGQQRVWVQRTTLMSAEAVAQAGLRALARGRPSVVPGWVNKAAVFSLRCMPRRLQAAAAHLAMNTGK